MGDEAGTRYGHADKGLRTDASEPQRTRVRAFGRTVLYNMHTQSRGQFRQPWENLGGCTKKPTPPRETRGPPAHTGRGLCFLCKKLSREHVQEMRNPRPVALTWQSAAVVALFRCFIPREKLTLQDFNFPKSVQIRVLFLSVFGIRVRRRGLYAVRVAPLKKLCCVFSLVIWPTAK